MTLVIHQWPDEATRTAENNCVYEAEAIIDDKRYSARSRRGGPFALARLLLAAGVADQPVLVTHAAMRGQMRYGSLHWMAEQTIEESARKPVHGTRYREFPGREDAREDAVSEGGAGGGEPQHGGSTAPDDDPACRDPRSRGMRLLRAAVPAATGVVEVLLAEVQSASEADASGSRTRAAINRDGGGLAAHQIC
jgi:hypothetical protein